MYRGKIVRDGPVVELQALTPAGDLLPLHLDLCNLSQTGLSWDNASGGSAQLDLALLADATGTDNLRLYQEFREYFVMNWDERGDWLLSQVRDLQVGEGLASG